MATAVRNSFAALMARPTVGVGVLVACYFAFNYRFFLSDVYLPLHDTGYFIQAFKVAYANFFHTGEIPEWLPQGVFGYQAHFQNIFSLSPFSFLVMAAGKLLGVMDAVVLFKAVVLLEVCVFAFGFLRLAGELFDDGRVSLLVLAPLLMTTIVINQITFMFRIVYLVPLMTYYMVCFFRTGKVWKLVLAGVIVLAALFGTNAYFLVYYGIYGVVVAGAFYVVHRKSFRLVFDRATVPAVIAGVLFAGVSSTLLLGAIDGLAFAVTDRDPVTLKVSLDTFLNYGRGGAVKMVEMLVAAPLNTLDVTFYVPAAALVFGIYAFFRERRPVFLALAAVFTVMVVVAWGRYSPLAYGLYYIPGVAYLRHLGLMYAVPKMLFCLIVGFGVQYFLKAASAGAEAYDKERRFLSVIAVLTAATVTAVLAVAVFVTGKLDWASPRAALVGLSAAGFIVMAVAVSNAAIRKNTLLAVAALVMIIQGGGYLLGTNMMISNGYAFPAAVKEELSRVRVYPFNETRPVFTAHPRYDLWKTFVRGRYFFQSYMIHYGALGMDLCFPKEPENKVEYFSPGVGDLVRHQFGPDASVRDLGGFYKKSPDAVFFKIAGCDGRSKLQLITRYEEDVLEPAASVPADAMGSAVLVERADTGERRLVQSVAGEYPNATSLAAQGITITDFSANRLAADIKVAGPDGAWLIYADAFDPGWRAAVNGKPATVWKANMAFKALYLPPGVNGVVFDFAHRGWQWAMWFVAIVSILVIVLGLMGPFKNPAKGPAKG